MQVIKVGTGSKIYLYACISLFLVSALLIFSSFNIHKILYTDSLNEQSLLTKISRLHETYLYTRSSHEVIYKYVLSKEIPANNFTYYSENKANILQIKNQQIQFQPQSLTSNTSKIFIEGNASNKLDENLSDSKNNETNQAAKKTQTLNIKIAKVEPKPQFSNKKIAYLIHEQMKVFLGEYDVCEESCQATLNCERKKVDPDSWTFKAGEKIVLKVTLLDKSENKCSLIIQKKDFRITKEIIFRSISGDVQSLIDQGWNLEFN